ncbi:MAG: methytransferase partner Trm112 [Dehalococcoidia bacterium]|jgi:uncharacterized protein YbaR (Trm112 family)
MKESIMEIIVCPVCKGPLELSVTERKDGEIFSGTLLCRKCAHSYPIQESIPNLLPPSINSQA